MGASLLFSLLALLIVFLVAGYLDKKNQSQAERGLWLTLLAAVLVGRGVFVALYWTQYQQDWLSILDLRDGGFYWQVAFLVVLGIITTWVTKTPKIKRTVLSAVAVGLLSFGASFSLYGFFSSPDDIHLPALELRTLNQEPVALTQFKGKPIVLNLWASWCPPCRREMPMLEAAQKNNPDLHFIFANQAEAAETVSGYLAAEHISLDNVLLDKDMDIARLVRSRGLPTTLFIDSEGKMHSYRMGELSAATLESHIRDLN